MAVPMNVRFGRPEHLNIRCKRRQVHLSGEIEMDLMLACGARLGSSVSPLKASPSTEGSWNDFWGPQSLTSTDSSLKARLGPGQKQFRLKDRC